MIRALQGRLDESRIPLADVRELARQLRRTRRIRRLLAAAVAVVAALALILAVGLQPGDERLLPPSASGIVVLDVSASITADTYRQIVSAVDALVRSEGRFGLVLFSDVAYEALPPATRAEELRSLRRFFRPVRGGETADPTGRLVLGASSYPATPWSARFSAGTKISSGLLLARSVLARERIADGSVLLISDLSTDQSDVPSTARAISGYVRDKVPLKIVALSPAPGDRRFFLRLMRGHGTIVDAPKVTLAEITEPRTAERPPEFPFAFAVAVAGLLLVLAANELWAGRLRFSRSPA